MHRQPADPPAHPPAHLGANRAASPAPAQPAGPTLRALRLPVLAMAAVIVLSNLLVQHPINNWLTWGAFTYPLVFLVTDLTNRALGPAAARRVVWAGFAVAVAASLALGPWRIALASGTAFLLAQWLDVALFNRWRAATWWKAPLIGSLLAAVVDTGVFFYLAFADFGPSWGFGVDAAWWQLAGGDLAVKGAMALLLLAPYRLLLPHLQQWAAPAYAQGPALPPAPGSAG